MLYDAYADGSLEVDTLVRSLLYQTLLLFLPVVKVDGVTVERVLLASQLWQNLPVACSKSDDRLFPRRGHPAVLLERR